MRLNRFITNNCCNYLGTACIGVWNTKRFNDTNKCWPLMSEKPIPCDYFEKVVLPLAIKLNYHKELVDEYSQVDLGIVKRTKTVKGKQTKKLNKKHRKRCGNKLNL